MSEKPNELGYLVAVRIAMIAGCLSIVLCALLFYDYSRRLTKDPLDSATIKSLLAAVYEQPANEKLKEQYRDLDLQLRREYFRQRVFSQVGAALLLVFVVVFVSAAKTAATLHRRMPAPLLLQSPKDHEAAWTAVARWAVAAMGLLLVVSAIALNLTSRHELPPANEELASASSSGKAEMELESLASKEPPPSDEEIHQWWPRFRGPDGLGISAYTNVPETWDGKSGKGIVWQTPVPLPGNNSPVVWGKRVFLSGADEHRREVYCFDADSGKLLWRQNVPGTPQSTARPPKVMEDTGYAAPTVATDGQRVFSIFANGDLVAFDFSGKSAWTKSLGLPENSYGHASSLAMYKNLLLVQFDQGSSTGGKSKLLAFNSATGKMAWQADRPVPNSWSSPIIIRSADRDQIITTADPWVIAYNPADGAEIWRAKCLNVDVGVSPVFAEGRVYAANDNAVLSAIRADGQGDVTATQILWKAEDGMPDTCSPLATKEYVFLLTSYGTLTCYDAVKGDLLWAEELGENITSSPSLVGNRVYLIANSGKSWIVEPTREKCKRIAEANLGEECVTSPAFQDRRIYLRGKDHLFCIGK